MRTTFAITCCALLAGCGLLSSDQATGIVEVINSIEQQGGLTAIQAEALRQAVLQNSGDPWWQQLTLGILEVALAVAGVRWIRGPAATASERAARIAARKSA